MNADERAKLQRLIADFDAAATDEHRSRHVLSEAVERLVHLAQVLRAFGLSSGRLARRMALAIGVPDSPRLRRRLGDLLRKRLERADRRHSFQDWPRGETRSDGLPLERSAAERQKEVMNGTLVKKTTVTEEYIDAEDLDELEEEEGDENEGSLDGKDDEEENEKKPRRGSRR